MNFLSESDRKQIKFTEEWVDMGLNVCPVCRKGKGKINIPNKEIAVYVIIWWRTGN